MEETGGTMAIISYSLEMQAPGQSWISIVGGDSTYNTDLSFLQTGLTTGDDYKFRVRASNEFGWGPYSAEVTIRADEVPATIDPVTTTAQTIYVRIDWSLVSTDYGSPVLEYFVQIQAKDGSYQTSPSCLGDDYEILTSLAPFCLVPFSELRTAPYQLEQGDQVIAQVKSRNVNGWSALSTPNTLGATI